METLNEIDEPLNPYSQLFMLFWAIAMIIVVGFQTSNQNELMSRHNVGNINRHQDTGLSKSDAAYAGLSWQHERKSPNSMTVNH